MHRLLPIATLLASALIAGVVTIDAISADAQTPLPSHAGMHAMALAGAPVATATVVVRDFAFVPQTIVVAAGATVTWTNADDEPHTVTANDRAYHSAALDTDQSYSHVFVTPGEYHYFCALHPHMTATVIVRAPGAALGH